MISLFLCLSLLWSLVYFRYVVTACSGEKCVRSSVFWSDFMFEQGIHRRGISVYPFCIFQECLSRSWQFQRQSASWWFTYCPTEITISWFQSILCKSVKHRLVFLNGEHIFPFSRRLIFEVTHRSKTGNTHKSGCFTTIERTDYRWFGVCKSKWLKRRHHLNKRGPGLRKLPLKRTYRH